MKLAVFDFDGTLFPKDTLPFLLKQWGKQHMGRRRFIGTSVSVGGMYVRYKMGLYAGDSREFVRRKAMDRFTPIFRRMSMKDVDAFFDRCAQLILPQLNAAVVDEMKLAKQLGFHTVLLSGGYQRLMDYVGQALGFDTIIATALHYKDGCVDATQTLDIVCGDDKATHLRGKFGETEIDWAKSTAYADSLSDLAILKLVGVPIAVNPEPELKEQAQSLGWRVLTC
jgi:HAD superfamily hydrolase (TIGR01490 family)